MNTIQKAAFAASAFAITLVGAAFVTAPLAFASPQPVVAHQACVASQTECKSPSPYAGLMAFNRR